MVDTEQAEKRAEPTAEPKLAEKGKIYPPVYPEISDWPIYKLHQDRTDFVEEIDEYTLARFMRKPHGELSDILAKTIYKERIRIKEEPWKVDPPNERQFWRRIRKKLVGESLDRNEEEAAKINEEILLTIIHRYSEEIVGTFRIQTFLFARRFLTFFFNRLLNSSLKPRFWGKVGKYRLQDRLICRGQVETVRALIKKGTVVVVPTHFSNLDSILIGYAMDTFMGLPSFAYGAGLNLYNTGYTAYFMNRLGAYRVDRRKKNPIYLETLKAMSTLAMQRGVNSLFFPGGTRSRSGSLETSLKLGLLGTAVEAQRANFQKGKQEKIFIVPLILSYHFVLEAQFLVEQYLRQIGREHYIARRDDFTSLRRILKFAWEVFSKGNDITLSFGQPMDVLGNHVSVEGESFDMHGNRIDVRDYFLSGGEVKTDLQRESEYTKLLSDRIIDRYHRDNIVLTSHLVAYASFQLLKHQHPRLDLYGLLRLPPDDFVFPEETLLAVIDKLREVLFAMEMRDEVKLSEKLWWDTRELLSDGINRLGTFHVTRPLRINKEGEMVSENFKLLYFYHNRLSTYGLDKRINWRPYTMAER